jgi:surfactin synthase thioesterase subunit
MRLVAVPGRGAPGYLRPWADRARRWTAVTVLDLPGWRAGRAARCAPTIEGIAEATAGWLADHPGPPAVLFGHSTAAQSVALVAARGADGLAGALLAGPVFDPAIGGWATLLGRAARTARHESLREVPAIAPKYLRGGVLPVLGLLRDGLRAGHGVYRPAPVPLAVLAGRHDHFAPPAWTAQLARRVGASHDVLPGGHNFCFTHPAATDQCIREVVAPWTARPQ